MVESLRQAGHEVDDCDLYAEGFDAVLSRSERVGYHDLASNRLPVAGYVARLQAAEALVLCFPVWNFGYPAILKGFFDRVFLPGVSFKLVDGKVRPNLWNIRKLAAVTTYGGSRWRALLMGDPPRKLVCRVLRGVCHPVGAATLSGALRHEPLDAGKQGGVPRDGRQKDARPVSRTSNCHQLVILTGEYAAGEMSSYPSKDRPRIER